MKIVERSKIIFIVEMFSVVYLNKNGNKKVKKILENIAKKMPDIHFMEI